MLYESVKLMILGFCLCVVLIFVLLNVIMGCGDWGSANCITPYEFGKMIVKPFTK